MGRSPIVCGNWKMNLGPAEGSKLAKSVVALATDFPSVEVWIAPPAISITAVTHVTGGSRVRVGSQNVHWESAGAFTGELPVEMLTEAGASFAIVGHSERRHLFMESDDLCAQRAKGALAKNFTIIFCIGEKLDEREGARTEAVLEAQLAPLLSGLSSSALANLVLAYEPVWAIGTGKVATLDQIRETHAYIRSHVEKLTGSTCPPILYGGSVKPDNFGAIIAIEDVAGALVGGASLKADQFGDLVKIAAN